MALIDLPPHSPGAGPSGAINTPAPIGRNLDSCECNAGSRLESPIESADRLTFWRNWYIASRQLPDNIRLAWYDAVLDFAFEGKEPQLPVGDSMQVADAVAFQAVAMVRATIDISRKRKQIGSKGGSKRQANRKQTPSKSKYKSKYKSKSKSIMLIALLLLRARSSCRRLISSSMLESSPGCRRTSPDPSTPTWWRPDGRTRTACTLRTGEGI